MRSNRRSSTSRWSKKKEVGPGVVGHEEHGERRAVDGVTRGRDRRARCGRAHIGAAKRLAR